MRFVLIKYEVQTVQIIRKWKTDGGTQQEQDERKYTNNKKRANQIMLILCDPTVTLTILHVCCVNLSHGYHLVSFLVAEPYHRSMLKL